jgi:protease-4
MSKLLLLLHTPHFSSIHRRALTSLIIPSPPSPLSSLHLHRRSLPLRNLSFSVKSKEEEEVVGKDGNEAGAEGKKVNSSESGRVRDEDYPSGEFQFEELSWWTKFTVKLKMLVAFPWERVRKGAVLNMKLRGQVFFFWINRFIFSLYIFLLCIMHHHHACMCVCTLELVFYWII